ncbi:inositol-pentakisphosphate 2-kinase-like isoform X1 [Vicia villosa]|uniref:inositol-pentakisphosphate 2-kinase-like isoform X1 n=1 Tax=Vicia villosa TaxID=3911 RepID=UPI00273B8EAA|nr:inositol-pentakisphosphate 2-kinase-like isoform X1 [Vicia villosa]
MVKGLHSQNLPADVAHVVDQLERHCLAPDGSLISKPLYNDLQLAREEMCRERLRYLEAMIGKVMCIRKASRNDSLTETSTNPSALTAQERYLWKDVDELISSSDNEIASQLFVLHVMKPLLGSKFVDAGDQSSIPLSMGSTYI